MKVIEGYDLRGRAMQVHACPLHHSRFGREQVKHAGFSKSIYFGAFIIYP